MPHRVGRVTARLCPGIVQDRRRQRHLNGGECGIDFGPRFGDQDRHALAEHRRLGLGRLKDAAARKRQHRGEQQRGAKITDHRDKLG